MNKTLVALSSLALIMGVLLVALPFVSVNRQITQAVVVPKSEAVVHTGWTPLVAVAPAHDMAKGRDLKAGEHYNIQVNATPGKNINFYINSGLTGLVFPYTGTANELAYQNVTNLAFDWIAPLNSTYSFAFNSTNLFSYRDVNISVTREWNETAYSVVTRNDPILPYGAVYVGLAIVLTVPAITLYLMVTRKHTRKTVT
jgi:hypothetical protein